MDLEQLDVTTLVSVLGDATRQRVRSALDVAGHGRLRDSHGYVVQRLLLAPRTPTELARELGMTQQGASKLAGELEELGYVRPSAGSGDGRRRPIELTERGRDAVQVARDARTELDAVLAGALGEATVASTRRALAAMVEELGWGDSVRRRALPYPGDSAPSASAAGAG